MESMTKSFFKDLYTADQEVQAEIILDNVMPHISYGMNHNLCMEFSEEEIGNALFQIGLLKAPEKMVSPLDYSSATRVSTKRI
jgi:hypothetical protein